MRFKKCCKRYLILLCFLCLIIFFGNLSNNSQNLHHKKISKQKFDIYVAKTKNCVLKKNFDLNKCKKFKIFIYKYPIMIKSPIYSNILTILKQSKYYTRNPNKACLFISSIDTLDQDPLSKNFIKPAAKSIPNLKYWNQGKNHLIFNMYSGTWPYYREKISFDTEQAILVKSSISSKFFRKNFDISFPLIHEDFPVNNSKVNIQTLIDHRRKYFLTFKGKRYLHGIGSNVRNKLYHLNNNRDVILVTTCKHGYAWTKFKDKRCNKDNSDYDKYDYNDLLNNSTFCLIPRGRRLGTYRFLEALKVGCIPVLASDGWILPFSEIIDWKKALVWTKENELMQVTSILREIPIEKVIEMRKLCLNLYEKYFSSLKTIIDTTINILERRIKHLKYFNDTCNI